MNITVASKSTNYTVQIDDEDFIRLEGSGMWIVGDGNGYKYVVVEANGRNWMLSRFVMSYSGKLLIDHIDGNTLNNQKTNLRVATRTQNRINSKLSSRNTTGYKGIRQVAGKWYASLTVDYKKIPLGSSYDREEAAKMYDVGAIKYFGQFARTNFPMEDLVGIEIEAQGSRYGSGETRVCQRCYQEFLYSGRGNAKYCLRCKY